MEGEGEMSLVSSVYLCENVFMYNEYIKMKSFNLVKDEIIILLLFSRISK